MSRLELLNSNKHFINDFLTLKECSLGHFEDPKMSTSSSETDDISSVREVSDLLWDIFYEPE